jgi:hypothetical protein
MAKDIYALLAGIVDYDETIALENNTVAFPALTGCVNDAKKIYTALQEIAGSGGLFVKELHNSQATKEGICRGFLDFLCQAKEGDSVVFYYSGHGTQEKADPCWVTETDGRLEALACFYDQSTKDKFLLADKELRYLLGKVAEGGPAITVIMDCCHSGDATRGEEMLTTGGDRPIPKRSKGAFAFSQRKWSDFIFHDLFSPEDVKTKGVAHLLPEAAQVFFSAAESNQSAFEIGGEGVFTKHLLRLLGMTNGYVSNQALFDRVALMMRYAYEQTPRLYTPAASAGLRSLGFLDGRTPAAGGSATAFYNSRQGWIINRGELHGLVAGMEPIELEPSSGSLGSPGPSGARGFSALTGLSGLPGVRAIVKKVMLDHALLELPERTDKGLTFFADLDYLARTPLKVFAALDTALPADAGSLLSTLEGLTAAVLQLVDKEDEADYSLQHLDGRYYLTHVHDRYRPVAGVVDALHFEELARQLRRLSRWTFVSRMGTGGAGAAGAAALRADAKASRADAKVGAKADAKTAAPLLLEYAVGDAEYQPLAGSKGSYTLPLNRWQTEGANITSTLRMRLTNNTGAPLYVGVLYLDLNFEVDTALLEPAPYLFESDDVVDLNVDGDEVLGVTFNAQAYYYNWRQYNEQFKIIVSDEPFEIYDLKMDPLPAPPLPAAGVEMGAIHARGINRSVTSFKGYTILTVDLVSINPCYDKLEPQDREAMLKDEATRVFAEGLYSGERKELFSAADCGSRNAFYQTLAARFPGRMKIVTEGDSWFQHREAYAIVDDLAKFYNIHCIAAGPRLMDYLGSSKGLGEHSLDILRRERPPVFLMSGGANDIFGPDLRQMLAGETFDARIDQLMAVYSTFFETLSIELPEMVTVVHGYDYFVHLDGVSPDVAAQWLDVFNARLAETAARYPDTVCYLDLRGSVVFRAGEADQWWDAVQPDSVAVRTIGSKYLRLIDKIKGRKIAKPTTYSIT